MKRLARLLLASSLVSSLALGMLCATKQAAMATPFSDVPANHWAYQYIQSLAADGLIDGYPDGKFKGDRPLTRYEMAVIVARVVAKLQENQYKGPSKEDLDKLQKLIDALKDELDSLGVRVTNLEDALDALDKRTKFAQSLSMHGVLLPNVSWRQRYVNPESIYNETGLPVTTYYGATAANGHNTTIDPFVNAFISTDDSNNPLTQNGSGFYIRQDSRFSLAYQITDKLTISLPVHILNYEYGNADASSARIDIEPAVEINLASVGAFSKPRCEVRSDRQHAVLADRLDLPGALWLGRRRPLRAALSADAGRSFVLGHLQRGRLRQPRHVGFDHASRSDASHHANRRGRPQRAQQRRGWVPLPDRRAAGRLHGSRRGGGAQDRHVQRRLGHADDGLPDLGRGPRVGIRLVV